MAITTQVETIHFKHHREALGVGEARPRLTWSVATDRPGWRQAAYEVLVSPSGGSPAWSSGRVDGPDAVLVGWHAPPLRSCGRCDVRVRVRGEGDSDPSPWSPVAPVEAGLLEPGDWQASAISPLSADVLGEGAVVTERSPTRRPPTAAARSERRPGRGGSGSGHGPTTTGPRCRRPRTGSS